MTTSTPDAVPTTAALIGAETSPVESSAVKPAAAASLVPRAPRPELLREVDVWVYYDRPRLWVSADPSGAQWLAVLLDETEDSVATLYVALPADVREALEAGLRPLREAFTSPPAGQAWIVTETYQDIGDSLERMLRTTLRVSASTLTEDQLPSPGAYLTPAS